MLSSYRIPCIPGVYTWLSWLWLRMITLHFQRHQQCQKVSIDSSNLVICNRVVMIVPNPSDDLWRLEETHTLWELNFFASIDSLELSHIYIYMTFFDSSVPVLRVPSNIPWILNTPRFLFERWSYLCRLFDCARLVHFMVASALGLGGSMSLPEWLKISQAPASMALISTQSFNFNAKPKHIASCVSTTIKKNHAHAIESDMQIIVEAIPLQGFQMDHSICKCDVIALD